MLQNKKPDYKPPLRNKKSPDYQKVAAGLRKLPPEVAGHVVEVYEEPKDLVQLSNSELRDLHNLDESHLNKIAE